MQIKKNHLKVDYIHLLFLQCQDEKSYSIGYPLSRCMREVMTETKKYVTTDHLEKTLSEQ